MWLWCCSRWAGGAAHESPARPSAAQHSRPGDLEPVVRGAVWRPGAGLRLGATSAGRRGRHLAECAARRLHRADPVAAARAGAVQLALRRDQFVAALSVASGGRRASGRCRRHGLYRPDPAGLAAVRLILGLMVCLPLPALAHGLFEQAFSERLPLWLTGALMLTAWALYL